MIMGIEVLSIDDTRICNKLHDYRNKRQIK